MWINSDFGRGQVLKKQGGLAQQHFNVGDMQNLIVAVPSKNEQLKIEKSIGIILFQLKDKQAILSTYKSLKKALMQDLLTGKVRVSVN
jgi:type I restriction enzyme S subunit